MTEKKDRVRTESEQKMKDRRMKKIISAFKKVSLSQIKHGSIDLTPIQREAQKLAEKYNLPIPVYSVDISGPYRWFGSFSHWYREVKVILTFFYHGIKIKQQVIETFRPSTHVDDYD